MCHTHLCIGIKYCLNYLTLSRVILMTVQICLGWRLISQASLTAPAHREPRRLGARLAGDRTPRCSIEGLI